MKIKQKLKKMLLILSISIILFGNIIPLVSFATTEKGETIKLQEEISQTEDESNIEETIKDSEIIPEESPVLSQEPNPSENPSTNLSEEPTIEDIEDTRQEDLEKDNVDNIHIENSVLENQVSQIETIAETNCEKVTNNIEYFKSSFFKYNLQEFNNESRGYSSTEFNNLTKEEKINIDSQHTLFNEYSNPYSAIGGFHNARNNTGNPLKGLEGVMQGLVGEKLLDNNISLTYKNNGNARFFPTYSQAEGQGLVGENQIYKKIYRDYLLPFIKEKSGYYSFDSTNYHISKNSGQSFSLHRDSNSNGFYPFKENCTDIIDENSLIYGMNLEVPFYMTADGKTINQETGNFEDIIFDFWGDDDVWIFIDDQLILDLGGPASKTVHTGYINFSKNQTYVKYKRLDENNFIQDIYTDNVFGDNLLNPGGHTLKIFYLERFGGLANFKTRFNLPQDIVQIKGNIEFKDGGNRYNTRPNNYTIKLYADGKYLQEQTIISPIPDQALDIYTSYNFGYLNRYNDQGELIKYSIEIYDINLDNGDKYIAKTELDYNVILTLTGTTSLTGKKIWEDKKNKYNTRPNNIKIQLFADTITKDIEVLDKKIGVMTGLKNNTVFSKADEICLIFDNNKKAYLKYPSGDIEEIMSGKTVMNGEVGKYIIQVGDVVKTFEVLGDIEDYEYFNQNSGDIIFHNINEIKKIEVDNKIFEGNDIPLMYHFSNRGKYTINITLKNGIHYSSQLILRKNPSSSATIEEIYYNYKDI